MTKARGGGDAAIDTALVARWEAGDERAATELVARHAPALARFVAASGGREDVDDVVQDAFVRAFGAIGSFRGESSFRTWLFSIARRLVLDRRRSVRRDPAHVPLGESDATTDYGALDRLIARETRGRLEEALRRLTPTQREVFALRVGEGLSHKEIAEVLGTTEGAARVHYHNAVRALKEQVNDE